MSTLSRIWRAVVDAWRTCPECNGRGHWWTGLPGERERIPCFRCRKSR